MEKRLILFIALSIAILAGANFFTVQKTKVAKTASVSTSEKIETSTAAISQTPINPIQLNPTTSNANSIVEYLENDNLKIEVSSFGAKISDIFIKRLDYRKNLIDPVNIVDKKENINLFLNFTANQQSIDLNSQNWQISKEQNSILFKAEPISGLVVAKKITLDENKFTGKILFTFENNSNFAINIDKVKFSWGPGTNINRKQNDAKNIIILNENKLNKINPKKKEDIQILSLKKGWVALKDQYFCSVFYGNAGNFESAEVRLHNDQSLDFSIVLPSKSVNANDKLQYETDFYFGPKNYFILNKIGYSLNKVVDFGLFPFLSIPIYYCLNYLFKITQNYGYAIILLTILIRALLWWPTQRSYSSMKKMQTAMNKMQPRLKTLKEIYRDNPAKLNEETMKLYKEYQINPMGGCLPMLLQMPIFIALYSTLISAVELKGAGFLWFWKDLSAKDPYYVLPILMGLSMFIQQKMSTPPAATPEAAAQQKMMLYFMPIMLTFFAFYWPSGLLLYWVVSNIISIGQQLIINQKA